jgi:TonB family protein
MLEIVIGISTDSLVINQERGCREKHFRHKAMSDLVGTTRESTVGGARPGRNSNEVMQDASPWPVRGPRHSDAYLSNRMEPMQATVRPIFAIDPLSFKGDPKSNAISFGIHAAAITLILFIAVKAHTIVPMQPTMIVTPVDFHVSIPPLTLPVAKAMGGGGGGGAHELVEAVKGNAPTVSRVQIAPPQVIRIDRPKLAVEPTEMVRMPDNNMPSLGVSQSPQIALAAQGRGSGSGFGSGSGGGIGSGHGSGAGPGSGGGYGGGLMSVGGGVSAPLVLHSVVPEFTDDARRANFQGSVSIKLIVDSQGNPQDVRLLSHLGMGLDERAVEAVKHYKFSPAMYEGHPVSVQILLDVAFRLH